ncbi:hypothetical protein GCM10028862_01730 [Luteimonas pelagia]
MNDKTDTNASSDKSKRPYEGQKPANTASEAGKDATPTSGTVAYGKEAPGKDATQDRQADRK